MMQMIPRRSLTAALFCAGLLAGGAATLAPVAAHAESAKTQVAQVPTAAAADFVSTLGDRAIAALADRSVGEAERKQLFRQLLTENFDVQTIGRFVLGPHWRNATPEQQAEYMELFQRMIVEVYTERFSEYAGEQFKVAGAQPAGQRDAVVASQVLRPDGPPVNVSWRVRERDGGFKIIDVIVENVSMSQTQRSEFASVIDSNGGRFDALLQALRNRIQTAERP
ncbi:MAG: hypothetical protein RLY86_346 [Pseudomonadota bacterium]